jgi:hypothetical protein
LLQARVNFEGLYYIYGEDGSFRSNLNTLGIFMKPKRKKWISFGWLFLANTVVSIGGGFFFYYLFGKDIRLHGGPLEVDFFNTVCGIFSIIGLGIAIFQLTDLRSEKQIVEEARKKIHTANFKRDYTSVLQEAIQSIKDLDALMNKTDFNETTFKGFLAKIDQILERFHKIEIQQVTIQCGTIVNCQKCLTLLDQLSTEFREIMDENTYQGFRKNYYIGIIKALKIEGERCEAEMLKK